MKKKIEAGKFYRTREGRKAGVYRTDVNHSEYNIHGYVIELNGAESPGSWTSDGRFFSTGADASDLISEWQETLDFDWDCLPPWCSKFIAMDKDGSWYAYSNDPALESGGFYDNIQSAIKIPKDYQPKNYTGDWKDSVFKNPNLD